MQAKYEVTVEEAHEHPFQDEYGVGCLIRETWRRDGKDLDRSVGPSIVLRHPVTGIPAQEEFFVKNKRHHARGGAAIIERDPYNGEVTKALYYEHGQAVPGPSDHAIDGPQF